MEFSSFLAALIFTLFFAALLFLIEYFLDPTTKKTRKEGFEAAKKLHTSYKRGYDNALGKLTFKEKLGRFKAEINFLEKNIQHAMNDLDEDEFNRGWIEYCKTAINHLQNLIENGK